MGRAPLLSFIVPVYNRKNLLGDCLENLLGPAGNDLEIILVDDRSNDGSWELAQEYAARYEQIRALRQPENRGPGAARNAGLKLARGRYAAFLDSDDQVLAESLAPLAEALRSNQEADIVALRFVVATPDGRQYPPMNYGPARILTPDQCLDQLPDLSYLTAWSFVFRLAFLRSHDLTFSESCYYEDTSLSSRAFALAARILWLPEDYYLVNTTNDDSLGRTEPTSGRDERTMAGIKGYLDCWSRHPDPLSQTRAAHFFNDLVAGTGLNFVFSRPPLTGMMHRALAGEDLEIAPGADFLLNRLKSFCRAIEGLSDGFSRPLYLAPANIWARGLARALEAYGGRVAGFVDNKPAASGPPDRDYPIVPFTQIGQAATAIGYCRLSTHQALSQQLISLGRNPGRDFVTFFH